MWACFADASTTSRWPWTWGATVIMSAGHHEAQGAGRVRRLARAAEQARGSCFHRLTVQA
eukprot:9156322-Pyramimonas_sp.AAC.1